MEKSIIITGASGEIGEVIAKSLSEKGFIISALYNRNKEKAEILKTRIENQGGKCEVFKCNLENFTEIKETINFIELNIAPIYALVNCAGVEHYGVFQNISEEELEHVLKINLSAAMLASKYVLRFMLDRKNGKIINISSVWGERGAAFEVAYSTAKAGLIGFTKALAKEVAPSNILVNCISPGAVYTEMTTKLGENTVKELEMEIPQRRLATPMDISNVVDFLISDKSNYFSGANLSLNGGWGI